MEEEERMWMMAAAAGFSGTLILGLLLYRERLKGKRLVERKKELEEELGSFSIWGDRSQQLSTTILKLMYPISKHSLKNQIV